MKVRQKVDKHYYSFLIPSRLVLELEKPIDIYLTSYSEYDRALNTENKKEALEHIKHAMYWAGILRERTDFRACAMILETAYDKLKKAIEEDEELDDEFIGMVETEVQEALICMVAKVVREACGYERTESGGTQADKAPQGNRADIRGAS